MAITAAEPLVTERRGVRRGLQASEHKGLLLGGDVVALVLAVLVALWTWSITAGFPLTLGFIQERAIWFLSIPAWLAALLPTYSLRTALSVRRTIRALGRAITVLLGAYLLSYFYAPRDELPRLVALYVLWEGGLLILAWRLTYLWLFTRPPFTKHLLIAGASDTGRTVLRLLKEAAPHTTIVGVVDDDRELWNQTIDGVPIIGGSEHLVEAVNQFGIGEIILAEPRDVGDTLLASLTACQEKGVDVVPMSRVYEELLHRVPVAHLESGWLFSSFVEAIRAKDASRIAKRLLDVVGGSVGLMLLLVIGPFVAAAIWLDSGRPIFYRQTRVGRGGTTFNLIKFRTMVPGAEGNGPPQWAGVRDPRATRVGRFLRQTRLDELPNFLSVLRGEMSLVGPRPERPEFVSLLERRVPFYRTRLIVRPGLTGWAQVNSPYGDSVDGAAEKLEYDLYYLKHRSFLFDVLILAKTMGTVIGFKGR